MPEPVIIVSGLPRSGTSMMMQMLTAGGLSPLTDEIRRPDEDNPRGYYEFEAVKQVRENAAWLDDAGGKVVKMVYRLLYDLPRSHQYDVIFMRRNLNEVIASQEVMLERHGKADDKVEPERLAEIYRRQLQEADDWLHKQPNFRVLYVEYRDVVDHPERVAPQLNDFLGGRLDTEAMLRVPDQSLHRQRA